MHVLIVGAGHAGAHAAAALRQRGFKGSIGLIGDEEGPPYERPPLSKDYLTGKRTIERMLLRPQAFYGDRGITLLAPGRVTAIDAAAGEVLTEDGRTLGYDILIWAAGGSARRLARPGANLPGVHTLRSRADADAIRTSMASRSHAVVVGGGYVGLEAASALAETCRSVTVLEAADRLLARVAGPAVAGFLAAEHRARGVAIRTLVDVVRIVGDDDVRAVELADGESIECGMVVVGIGIEPNTAALQRAGGAGPYGAPVDAECRTALPNVFAIGDCALQASRFSTGRAARIESVQNALHQAELAAAAITRTEAPMDPVPLFWSNQFDLRMQSAGLSTGFDEETVDPDQPPGSIAVTYLRAGIPVAVDCVNATRAFTAGRRAIEAAARPA